MNRRARQFTYAALAVTSLAGGVWFGVTLRARLSAPQVANQGGPPNADPAPVRNLPVDDRPRPQGAVERFGFARAKAKSLANRRESTAIAYSADGKLLAVNDWTGGANMLGYTIWDTETGAAVAEVPTPIRALYGVALSPDGKRLAWAGNAGDAVMGVSEVSTGTALWQTKGANYVGFSADGRYVIGGYYGGAVVVADAATGKVVHTLTEPDRYANSLVLSRDGTTVVASTEKKRTQNYAANEAKVEVWDVATGKPRKVVASKPYTFGSRQVIAITSDGKAVAFSEGKHMTVVEVETGAQRWKIENPGGNHVWEFAAFSPSGDTLLAMRSNYDTFTTTTVDLLDAKTGQVVRTFDGSEYQFSQAMFSPDGKRVVTYGQSVPLRIWDVATGKLLPEHEGHRSLPTMFAMSDNGDTLATADSSYSVCVWDKSGLRRRFDLRSVQSLGLSGDGKTAIVSGPDTSTLALDVASGSRRVLTRYRTQGSAISRDGTRAAVSNFGDLIQIVDVANGTVVQSLYGQAGDLYAMAFSPDGKRLLTAARTRARGPFNGEVDGGGGAPQGHDDTIRVWDTATGKELRLWRCTAQCAAMTPDGRMMLAGDKDGHIRRLDVEPDKELEPLMLHKGGVLALAVSPDGKRAASASGDTVIVWELATGRELKRFTPDNGTPYALAFTADGRRLASAGGDGTILMWDTGE